MPRILPGVIAMAIIVVASNILVQYQLGNWLTWGALTYPIAFLVTDIMNRVYGTQAARRVGQDLLAVVLHLVGLALLKHCEGFGAHIHLGCARRGDLVSHLDDGVEQLRIEVSLLVL